MNRISIVTLASLALAAGCSKNNQPSDNPDAGAYGGFSDDTPGGEGDDANSGVASDGDTAAKPSTHKPGARASSSTKAGKSRVGKHRSLVAKKPPVKTKDKPDKPPKKSDYTPKDPPIVLGAVPTVIVVGGVFNVYGEAFDPEPSKNKVYIGSKLQKVLAVAGDHLIVEATTPGAGRLRVGKQGMRRANAAAASTKTHNAYTVIAAGDGLARPAATAGHGLLGTLYNIGQASTEVPDFNAIGDPVGYLMMDNLDVATTGFAGFTVGGEALKENFGIHVQGSLNVVDNGDYELCLDAGDGAILFLNGEPLLDNAGSGATRSVCDTVEIEAGEYDLQLLYYQNDGDLALRLTWAKDGGAAVPIPATAFFPPENMDGLAQSLNQE